MRHLFLNAMLCLLFSGNVTHASEVSIENFTLSNGLKVIVLPNHRVPAVSHMIWFPTGGADDPLGKSGLTHFHEHVMFKGTKAFPAGQFEAIISALGGDQNAFTGYDATAYYINIDKKHLPRAMELEADRLRGLDPVPESIIKEREVIIEERRARVENNPKALFAEQLASLLYVHHPYGTPLIGWQHEMAELTMDDVLEFHRIHYNVNSAVLVLAGDITAAEAKPLVEQYYGSIEPVSQVPKRQWVSEPAARVAKRFTMRHPLQSEPYFRRDYLAPSMVTGEKQHVLPLMVFAEYFGGDQTSTLYQELVVKQKLATQISANYNGYAIGPESFSITAVPADGVSVDALEQAIDQLIKKTLSTTPDEVTLNRTKTSLKAETIFAREGLQPMAYIVGWLTMIGLPSDYINQWSALIDKVSTNDIQKAAAYTLKPEGSVTGVLLPESKGDKR